MEIIDSLLEEDEDAIESLVEVTKSKDDEIHRELKSCLVFTERSDYIEVDKIVQVLKFLNINLPPYMRENVRVLKRIDC